MPVDEVVDCSDETDSIKGLKSVGDWDEVDGNAVTVGYGVEETKGEEESGVKERQDEQRLSPRVAEEQPQFRFKLGERVLANVGEWREGIISQLNWREADWGPSHPSSPYQIAIDPECRFVSFPFIVYGNGNVASANEVCSSLLSTSTGGDHFRACTCR